MDSLYTLLGTTDITPLMLITGVGLLLVNIVYGAIRTALGNVRAGRFTVGLALVACVLIGIGSARSVLTPGSTQAARNNVSGNGSITTPAPASANHTAGASNSDAVPVIAVSNTDFAAPGQSGATSTRMPPPTNTPRAVAAVPSATPDTATATPIAAATGSGRGSRSAASGTGGSSASGQGGNSSGQNSGQAGSANGSGAATGGNNSASGFTLSSSNSAGVTALDQNALFAALLGGALSIVLGLGLYFFERRRDGFTPTSSRGLLNAGASLFVVVAALVIPLLPGQLANAATSPTGSSARSAFATTRTLITATPSPLPTLTQTPTPLPSLTPTMTETPFATPTEISYVAAQPTVTPGTAVTACMVTVAGHVNLRADPSTTNPPLLTFQTQVSLPVSGESKDKQWWQVAYNNNGKTITGWVSAPLVKVNGACNTVTVVS